MAGGETGSNLRFFRKSHIPAAISMGFDALSPNMTIKTFCDNSRWLSGQLKFDGIAYFGQKITIFPEYQVLHVN